MENKSYERPQLKCNSLFLCPFQYEQISRLDFLWKLQATEEKEDMEGIREYNKKLLHNILPSHVAEHFLLAKGKKNEVYARFIDCTLFFYKKLRSDLSTESFLALCDFEYSKFLDSFLTLS